MKDVCFTVSSMWRSEQPSAEAVAWWIREEKSSQHTVYPHNAWNGALLSVVMRATELLDTVSSSPSFYVSLCCACSELWEAIVTRAMTAALLVLSESAMGSMYPLTLSSCKNVLGILSISDGTCCGVKRKDGGRRLYLTCSGISHSHHIELECPLKAHVIKAWSAGDGAEGHHEARRGDV